MTKTFCDWCGDEITRLVDRAWVDLRMTHSVDRRYDLCTDCGAHLIATLAVKRESK